MKAKKLTSFAQNNAKTLNMVVDDIKNIIHVTFSEVDVWTLTLSPASS